jgi:hypothetical protein
VIYGVLGRVLQQGADEGEVRDYPVEGKGGARVELTMGREMAARRREDGALVWPAKEKNEKGRKMGHGGDMAPF